MSIEILGYVQQLFISEINKKERVQANSIEVDLKGVLKDKFYDKGEHRSVLLTSILAYDLIKKNNIQINYGALGENILLDFNPYDLKETSHLVIGDTILEITQECTICNHLSHIAPKVPKILENDRGVFAKVIQCGRIRIGDAIKIIN
jgi:MOSC domain-containing protein YiiM